MDAPRRPPRDMEAFSDGVCRLILIGKTGCGKSATGNSILGREKFVSRAGINSETEICDMGSTQRDHLLITVMDTPGLADTTGRDEVIAQLITRSLLAVHPGPHAILLCIRCDDRFTDIEYNVYQSLKEIFGEKMTSHLIVIFVGADQLREGGAKFEEQLQHGKSGRLRSLLSEADNRYLLFTNRADKATKEAQVSKLLLEVKKIVMQNGGQCFKHKVSPQVRITWDRIVEEELRNGERETDSQTTRSPSSTTSGSPQGQGQVSPRQQGEDKQEAARKGLQELRVGGNVKDRAQLFETGQTGEQTKPLAAVSPYSVPDRPGMTMAEKQAMVDNVLRKVVRNPEELNSEQWKCLDEGSKSIGEKIKEGMKKFAVRALEQCRLM